MYEYIKGTVTFVGPAYVVIEANSIGYLLYMANPFRFSNKLNKEVTIYVHQAVREDAITLYGFKDYNEKQLYLKLISVSGIGPKSGLAILANDDHAGLIQAIESEDVSYLTKFPGVGKKTASQIILDLKGKLDELEVVSTSAEGSVQQELPLSTNHGPVNEAIEALAALGYSAREIKKIEPDIRKLNKETTDAYLREALRLLMKK
ncbi:Holliday junction branch migration protein RuvA [Carnobacterium sp.]|uniref:Holliday junction branch migration protein RuvA n=1 Tax=Carnobacterium sp. TaxID=48221 RepID=UPI0028A72243|nr:Holliday junction branch migration protein RuvA [Carnobacterium sp.]